MKSTFDLTVESLLNELQLGRMAWNAAKGAAGLASKAAGGLASTALGMGPVAGVKAAGALNTKLGDTAAIYGGGSSKKEDTGVPGESSMPKDQAASTTPTAAAVATADVSIKSIAPKITDKKIDNILAQTSLQPGDKQLIKSQLMTTVKQLKGNVSRNQLMDIMNKIMS